MQSLAIGVRCLIGVVFLVSFASKLAGRAAFRDSVQSIRGAGVLPPRLATSVLVVVIAGEMSISALLMVPVQMANVVAYTIAIGLLSVFIAGIVTSMRRGSRVPCRCFGRSTAPLGMRHIVRNLGLLALCVVGVMAPADLVQGSGQAVAAIAGLVLGALITQFDLIVDLFRPAGKSVHETPVPVASRRRNVRTSAGRRPRRILGRHQSDLHSRGDQAST
ncbi:MauE/DoxX family redox-associated membrane protein [Nonomuraea typhae]|uniref:MauE/DoxX family redox-associated membrane protein n=1 Tax=Nonomuraea typhae TaxID=2603600 RepID=A0ABW7YMP1_9ACTN